MAAERELSIKITGDTRGLGRAFGQVDREASKMERGLGGLRRGFGTLAKASGVAVVALGAASVAFGKTAVDAASDLDESLNKSSEVFKKHGDAVAKWSKDSATAMGLSQAAALDALLIHRGDVDGRWDRPKRAADMSRSMVELAGDMSSLTTRTHQISTGSGGTVCNLSRESGRDVLIEPASPHFGTRSGTPRRRKSQRRRSRPATASCEGHRGPAGRLRPHLGRMANHPMSSRTVRQPPGTIGQANATVSKLASGDQRGIAG